MPSLDIPEAVSFEQAIALTQALLSAIEAESLSESKIEQVVSALVKTQNGARGFFVTYLTDERWI
jgi:CHASE3 domain sensor protein